MLTSWLRLKRAGVSIAFAQAFAMHVRGTLKRDFVHNMLVTKDAGLGFSVAELETIYLCQGKADSLISAAQMLKENGAAYSTSNLLFLALHPTHDPLEFVRDFLKRAGDQPQLSFADFFNELFRDKGAVDTAYLPGEPESPTAKENPKITALIFGLFTLAIIYLYSSSIKEIKDYYHVEKTGIRTEADIAYRNTGTNKIWLVYSVDEKIYKKSIKVGDDVYAKYENSSKLPIKVLKEEPTVISWNGNRAVYINSYNLIVLIFPGSIFVLLFIYYFKKSMTA